MPLSDDELDRVREAKTRLDKPRRTPRRKRVPNTPRTSYGTGLAAYRKTVAGVLTPAVTYAVTRWLLGFPPEAIAPTVGVLTGVVVWATPNAIITKSYG